MSAPRRPAASLGISAALLAVLGGCAAEPQAPPPMAGPSVTATEVRAVRKNFAVPGDPSDEEAGRLVAALRAFAGPGRMDALHVSLPSGPGMDGLAWRLVLEGVVPRKIRRNSRFAGTGRIVAERYLALVPPCPALDLVGGAFGPNATRPGFGCASQASFAAQAADPADLLGSDAAPPTDPERAALPVARWRGGEGARTGGGGPAPTTQAPAGATTSTSAQ